MHKTISPNILYFGTPVALISTCNEDGSPNLAPVSSVWWIDHSCMIGMGTRSKTAENLQREKECVINLPTGNQVGIVDRLALTTGRDPVPPGKAEMGYEYVPDKFRHALLTQMISEEVRPPRVGECPVQLEAIVRRTHPFGEDESTLAFEAQILKIHIEESILNTERRHHIDPDKWNPLIMSFCEFYGLGRLLHPSRLAEVF